jgi:hypothetical protein
MSGLAHLEDELGGDPAHLPVLVREQPVQSVDHLLARQLADAAERLIAHRIRCVVGADEREQSRDLLGIFAIDVPFHRGQRGFAPFLRVGFIEREAQQVVHGGRLPDLLE